MNNENLSRDEAAHRSELLSVDTYDVHVDLTNAADTSFASYPTATTVRFTARAAEETFIDYIHQSIDSIKLNGGHINTAESIDGSRIRFTPVEGENILTIHGRSYFSRSGEGLHRYTDPTDDKTYLYTQYEPADCRRVFPNFEQPDLKAVFNFRITAPAHWVVSSNAELDRTLEDPADSSISKRVFKPTARISTYITTILAGEYFVASDTYVPTSTVNSGKIPLVAYCRASLAEYFDAENIFTVTKQGLDFFQDLFDYAYPFKKYEQAFVPEYNLGAMENPGMVTFTESYIYISGATQADLESRANVICHEMSHMWFGDLVTMKWWDDLWLKESFADFMGTLGSIQANGFEDAWTTFANRRKSWAYYQDQLPTTHPIVADIPHLEAAKQNFDGITYAKGASALKQLVAYVGFETFIDAARAYFKKHEYGNTTLDDFLSVLDEKSDRDVKTWAQAWLQTSGLSSLSTERIFAEDGTLQELRIHQELPAGVPTGLGRPHQLMLETFIASDDEEPQLTSTGKFSLEIPAGDSQSVAIDLDAEAREQVATADLLLLNSGDQTYAKVYLSDEDGLQTALKSVSTIDDALARGLLWGSLWNQVRDGKLAAATFIRAVEFNLTREPSATLLAALTSQAQSAISLYTAPAEQASLWDSLYSALSDALESAESSSDAQLILMRSTLAVAAHSPLGIEFAREVSRGAIEDLKDADIEGLQGLKYTQTLGWSALIALAAHSEVDDLTLETARAYQSSATSERGFAYASAAFPNAQAKQAAFTAVTTDQELSNEILTATANGFKLGEEKLHVEFYPQYFEQLLDTWNDRSIGMATRVVTGLYPAAVLRENIAIEEHPAVAMGEKWLEENPDAPSALRREIIENVADARRALTAQQASSR